MLWRYMMITMTELLRQFLLDVYCLSEHALIVCCVAGTLGYHGLHRRYVQKSWWRMASLLLLMLWTAAVLWATVLGREDGQCELFQAVPFHSYRQVLLGGNREILRSSFMNVLLFFPAGLLFAGQLPQRLRSIQKLVCTILIFSLFSLGIELTQFTRRLGLGEIDDVLHNTLGASLGMTTFGLAEWYKNHQGISDPVK